jgi:hypothetical protein
MKKIAIATLALAAFAASAADFVSIDVDQVTDRATKQKSVAEYVRAGKEIGGIQYGLQSRTARYADNSGMYNSLELTAGKTIAGVSPFVGVGYDNGKNGAVNGQYEYGLVGVTAGTQVGPGFLLGGVKTRVNFHAGNPKQTVEFATYSIPVATKVSLNLGASYSQQTIQEKAISAGVTVAF